MRTPSPFKKHWLLDEKAIYLNHGAFGACPVAVLEKQNQYRSMLEMHPLRFMLRQMRALHARSKAALATFVHAPEQDIAFVSNATQGVNTVLRSLTFNPGDEILITNHIYPACRNTVNFIAGRTGARVVEAKIPFPITSEEEITEAILECINPSTRIALIDHITAPTALIVPLKALVPTLQEKGIQVLVDGAHAPGNIPVDILDINPDYYTANCHKWLCAPKGAAFLYVRPDRQQQIDPLTISLAAGHDKTFEEKFYWTGTYDPTAVLCVADAIEYMGTLLPGGWPAIMKNNHRLTVQARQLVCNELGIAIPCPDAMIPSMASFFITDTENPVSFGFDHVDSLQQQLFDTHQIEIPISYWPAPPKRLIRLSAQLYNSPDEYKLLADALKKYCYS